MNNKTVKQASLHRKRRHHHAPHTHHAYNHHFHTSLHLAALTKKHNQQKAKDKPPLADNGQPRDQFAALKNFYFSREQEKQTNFSAAQATNADFSTLAKLAGYSAGSLLFLKGLPTLATPNGAPATTQSFSGTMRLGKALKTGVKMKGVARTIGPVRFLGGVGEATLGGLNTYYALQQRKAALAAGDASALADANHSLVINGSLATRGALDARLGLRGAVRTLTRSEKLTKAVELGNSRAGLLRRGVGVTYAIDTLERLKYAGDLSRSGRIDDKELAALSGGALYRGALTVGVMSKYPVISLPSQAVLGAAALTEAGIAYKTGKQVDVLSKAYPYLGTLNVVTTPIRIGKAVGEPIGKKIIQGVTGWSGEEIERRLTDSKRQQDAFAKNHSIIGRLAYLDDNHIINAEDAVMRRFPRAVSESASTITNSRAAKAVSRTVSAVANNRVAKIFLPEDMGIADAISLSGGRALHAFKGVLDLAQKPILKYVTGYSDQEIEQSETGFQKAKEVYKTEHPWWGQLLVLGP